MEELALGLATRGDLPRLELGILVESSCVTAKRFVPSTLGRLTMERRRITALTLLILLAPSAALQQAIDAAFKAGGGTVVFPAGRYVSGTLTLPSRIRLELEAGAVLQNCHIVAGDDCIVMKSNAGGPIENVVITNGALESIATAVKLGTESPEDFRDIRVSNCVIRNSTVGLGIFLKDGGTIERVSFTNISIENPPRSVAEQPNAGWLARSLFRVFVDIERRHPDSPIGTIRDLSLTNLHIESGAGIVIQGMPQSPIENLLLRDITFRVNQPWNYGQRRKHIGGWRTASDERDTLFVRRPAYVTLAHTTDALIDNLRLYSSPEDHAAYPRAVLGVFESTHASIGHVQRPPPDPDGPVPAILEGTGRAAINVLAGAQAACFSPRDRE
jgi:hypothetical protein